MQRKDLEKLSREELIAKAEEHGITRPRTLTMPELVDEILLAVEKTTGQKKPRGWFGRARDLLTSVIDLGLTSDGVRKQAPRTAPAAPPPLPTVTLAEIYAAQGHFERAITTLDEVLARDPAHADAAKLRERFVEQLRRTRPSSPPQAAGEQRPSQIPPPGPSPAVDTPADTPAGAAHPSSVVVAAPIDPTVTEAPAELDDRYDVDEVVAIAVDPHTIYAYWEVKPSTLAGLRASTPNGALVLRVLTVQPGNGASHRIARDVRIDALDGDVFVRDLPANVEVRVAVGWLELASKHHGGGAFHPIAVGLDLSTPHEAPAENVAVHFGRMSPGGIAEGYDALRAGGIVGKRPVLPAFGRPSREEISLGHAPESDGAEDAYLGDGVEITTIRTGVPTITTERTVRRGASEQLITERRFVGASENLVQRRRGGPSSMSLVSFVVSGQAGPQPRGRASSSPR